MKTNKPIILLLLSALVIFTTQAQNITINGIRNYTIDANTVIRIDEAVIDPANFPYEIIGTGGFKIRFKLADDVNTTMSAGTLTELNFISDIVGPVTSTIPLKILDQNVFVTGNTNLQNITQIADVAVNDMIATSGTIFATDNSMQLSRIEKKQTLQMWKLRGYAQNITATSFNIGNLSINLNGVMATGCGSGFVNNTFVAIKATPDPSYIAGNPLTTLTEIVCESADVDVDINDSVAVVVEGFVSELIDLVSFKVNELTVIIDAQTTFDNGEFEHIDIGSKIEVQGIIDTINRTITASSIRFINHRVKIQAPVSPADIVINSSINILGKQVLITPQTRDEDGILSSGILQARQVEIKGFVDSQGQIYAQRIEDELQPDFQDIVLRGDITAINQPFISILGIAIDASSSLFELESGLVSLEVFFAHIQVGMQVSIENAIYDTQTQQLSFGIFELLEEELVDDADDSFNKRGAIDAAVGVGGIGIATVTATEIIFRTNFE